jgi:hypothetical protein
MNWQQTVTHWRNLPPQEKQRRRWESIPTRVARSMAFENEPVDEKNLRAKHARGTPPAMSKPVGAS